MNDVLAPKVRDLFLDSAGNWIPSDYKVMYGGRAGLKSWGFARMAVLLAAKRRTRVACAREYQTSIRESVHETLCTQIEALGLQRYFDIGVSRITVPHTRSEFFFAGIRTDPAKFKSTEGIDILWVDEGESVTEDSWQKIEPTIRTPGSEIWCSFNPDLEGDATSKRFIVDPVPNSRIVETNWRDNPWLPEKLDLQRQYLARVDPDSYQHVWEGKFRKNSKSQILANKYAIEDFEPAAGWDGPYYGADWGFAQDPTTLVKLWIHGATLYVEHEAYEVGRDIDRTPELFDQVPGARDHTIRADSARPETISYMQRHGYPAMTGVEKWKGSVEDGIAHLRQYERIVIHPRCKHAADEARLYSYKVDRKSGDVLTDVMDANNHVIDAMRYALSPLIRNVNTGLLLHFQLEAENLAAERERAKGK